MPKKPEQQELPAIVAHDKRHGGVLYVDMPVMAESTLKERAETCLRALAISEGLRACKGGGTGMPCQFPRCMLDGCEASRGG